MDETWRNATQGTAAVIKRDRMGNETHILVNGGKTFTLTKEERLLNMDRAANPDLDLFSNGTLIPVRLIEGDEDARELASNPNLMGEAEMKELFKGHWRTFESKINSIRNPLLLERMLEMAQELDATVRQVGIIETRLDEVSPKKFTERDIEVVGQAGPEVGNPVTPK